MLELHIKTRDVKENLETIRESGNIPAVFYGPKEENTPVTLDAREFARVWGEAGGSTIVDLKGVGEDKEVLIHDVVKHPVKGNPIHVDFYCIERGKKLTVNVPLEFVGEAPVEKIGGIVVKVMHELEIEVQPRNIPHTIEVDLSPLTDFDSSISIADLHLDETIEPTADVNENVASVTQAKEEPKEEEVERDISDIEIESKGKDAEGDDDGGDQDEEK